MKVFPLSDFRIQEEFQWIVMDLRSLLDEKRSGDLLQCRQEARKSLEEILSDTLKGYPFTFWSSIKCWLRKLFLGETNPEEWSKKLIKKHYSHLERAEGKPKLATHERSPSLENYLEKAFSVPGIPVEKRRDILDKVEQEWQKIIWSQASSFFRPKIREALGSIGDCFFTFVGRDFVDFQILSHFLIGGPTGPIELGGEMIFPKTFSQDTESFADEVAGFIKEKRKEHSSPPIVITSDRNFRDFIDQKGLLTYFLEPSQRDDLEQFAHRLKASKHSQKVQIPRENLEEKLDLHMKHVAQTPHPEISALLVASQEKKGACEIVEKILREKCESFRNQDSANSELLPCSQATARISHVIEFSPEDRENCHTKIMKVEGFYLDPTDTVVWKGLESWKGWWYVFSLLFRFLLGAILALGAALGAIVGMKIDQKMVLEFFQNSFSSFWESHGPWLGLFAGVIASLIILGINSSYWEFLLYPPSLQRKKERISFIQKYLLSGKEWVYSLKHFLLGLLTILSGFLLYPLGERIFDYFGKKKDGGWKEKGKFCITLLIYFLILFCSFKIHIGLSLALLISHLAIYGLVKYYRAKKERVVKILILDGMEHISGKILYDLIDSYNAQNIANLSTSYLLIGIWNKEGNLFSLPSSEIPMEVLDHLSSREVNLWFEKNKTIFQDKYPQEGADTFQKQVEQYLRGVFGFSDFFLQYTYHEFPQITKTFSTYLSFLEHSERDMISATGQDESGLALTPLEQKIMRKFHNKVCGTLLEDLSSSEIAFLERFTLVQKYFRQKKLSIDYGFLKKGLFPILSASITLESEEKLFEEHLLKYWILETEEEPHQEESLYKKSVRMNFLLYDHLKNQLKDDPQLLPGHLKILRQNVLEKLRQWNKDPQWNHKHLTSFKLAFLKLLYLACCLHKELEEYPHLEPYLLKKDSFWDKTGHLISLLSQVSSQNQPEKEALEFIKNLGEGKGKGKGILTAEKLGVQREEEKAEDTSQIEDLEIGDIIEEQYYGNIQYYEKVLENFPSDRGKESIIARINLAKLQGSSYSRSFSESDETLKKAESMIEESVLSDDDKKALSLRIQLERCYNYVKDKRYEQSETTPEKQKENLKNLLKPLLQGWKDYSSRSSDPYFTFPKIVLTYIHIKNRLWEKKFFWETLNEAMCEVEGLGKEDLDLAFEKGWEYFERYSPGDSPVYGDIHLLKLRLLNQKLKECRRMGNAEEFERVLEKIEQVSTTVEKQKGIDYGKQLLLEIETTKVLNALQYFRFEEALQTCRYIIDEYRSFVTPTYRELYKLQIYHSLGVLLKFTEAPKMISWREEEGDSIPREIRKRAALCKEIRLLERAVEKIEGDLENIREFHSHSEDSHQRERKIFESSMDNLRIYLSYFHHYLKSPEYHSFFKTLVEKYPSFFRSPREYFPKTSQNSEETPQKEDFPKLPKDLNKTDLLLLYGRVLLSPYPDKALNISIPPSSENLLSHLQKNAHGIWSREWSWVDTLFIEVLESFWNKMENENDHLDRSLYLFWFFGLLFERIKLQRERPFTGQNQSVLEDMVSRCLRKEGDQTRSPIEEWIHHTFGPNPRNPEEKGDQSKERFPFQNPWLDKTLRFYFQLLSTFYNSGKGRWILPGARWFEKEEKRQREDWERCPI